MPVLGTNFGRFINPTGDLELDHIGLDFLLSETIVAVSHQRRYAGHAGCYTVGQHLLLLGRMWEQLFMNCTWYGRITEKAILFKLLTHDLHEAYIVDMP